MDRHERQQRVAAWAGEAFGIEQATSLPQRGIRLFEESTETLQAAGGSRAMAHKLVDHVFDRPVGDLRQELGGVAVTLLALAAAAGLSAEEAEVAEVERVLAKPFEHFARRNAEKNAAGFLATGAAAPEPCRACGYIVKHTGEQPCTEARGCSELLYHLLLARFMQLSLGRPLSEGVLEAIRRAGLTIEDLDAEQKLRDDIEILSRSIVIGGRLTGDRSKLPPAPPFDIAPVRDWITDGDIRVRFLAVLEALVGMIELADGKRSWVEIEDLATDIAKRGTRILGEFQDRDYDGEPGEGDDG